MIYNEEKLSELITTADYVSVVYRGKTSYISPVSVNYPGVYWINNRNVIDVLYFSEFSNNFVLSHQDNNFCNFEYKLDEAYNTRTTELSSISFYYITPIEISRLFENIEDLMRLFRVSSKERIVYEKYGENKQTLKLVVSEQNFYTNKIIKCSNIQKFENPYEINMRRIFDNQLKVENNAIYLLSNVWIKFYKLFPISFEEAIVN